ncbi:MAG TPA: hypothetical protein VHO27_11965, partial [Angustibacter sp.]|nr:hypothetical protein [Angustibacter sp.]
AAVADLVAAVTAADAGAVRDTKAVLQGAALRSLEEQYAVERAGQARRFSALSKALRQPLG